MSTPVTVSPLSAHFLLRSTLEQSIIVAATVVPALPFAIITALQAWQISIGVASIMALVTYFVARLGCRLGTWAANIVALLRIRRARREGGAQ